ncbi:MAG: FHA domain-containing protein [Actinomycetota bacterium]|nr:FHA domain-containing protein [Actinomycetota bacterium]
MDEQGDVTGVEAPEELDVLADLEDLGEIGLLDELIAGLATLQEGDVEGDDIEEVARVAVDIGGVTVTIAAGESVDIGRGSHGELTHPAVSRRHLRLWRDGDVLWCRDAGSGNGSWLERGGERQRIGGDAIDLVALDRIVTIQDVELLRVDEDR